MSRDKSFALYAMPIQPANEIGDYTPLFIHRRGVKYTIWVRVELHDCHYSEAMDKVSLREGENFLNTQPA